MKYIWNFPNPKYHVGSDFRMTPGLKHVYVEKMYLCNSNLFFENLFPQYFGISILVPLLQMKIRIKWSICTFQTSLWNHEIENTPYSYKIYTQT